MSNGNARDGAASRPSTIALLHLAPRPGAIERNRRDIERAARKAARAGARLVVTPELALSGYGFRDTVGTDWIALQAPEHEGWAAALAREIAASVVVGMPEAGEDGLLFNTMTLFDATGRLAGRHRKINALRAGSESWSTGGDRPTVLKIGGIGRVGMAICADMYSERLARETAALGCDIILSSAAWADGHHGPAGEWERASRETGLPVLVCNRTGVDVLDFAPARTVAAVGGTIAFSHCSPQPAMVLVDWTPARRELDNWRVESLVA